MGGDGAPRHEVLRIMGPALCRRRMELTLLRRIAPQLAGEALLQKELDGLDAIFIDLDNPGPDVPVESMLDLESAPDELAGIDLAFEVEYLAGFEVSRAHQLAATVAHVLEHARKTFVSVTQNPFSGYRNS